MYDSSFYDFARLNKVGVHPTLHLLCLGALLLLSSTITQARGAPWRVSLCRTWELQMRWRYLLMPSLRKVHPVFYQFPPKLANSPVFSVLGRVSTTSKASMLTKFSLVVHLLFTILYDLAIVCLQSRLFLYGTYSLLESLMHAPDISTARSYMYRCTELKTTVAGASPCSLLDSAARSM